MWNWDYTNVNNCFFEKWSPELAYIVGLFIADGSISNYEKSGKKKVTFSNQILDIDMLEKVAKVSGYKNKLLKFKSGMCRVQFAGDFVWRFFKTLGFDNHKTTNAKVPVQLLHTEDLHSHLIRGIFDGDGSVSIRNRDSTYPSANIVGTQNIVKFVSETCPFYNTMAPHKSIFRVTFEGANAVKFLNCIYKDSTIHMNRKYEKFLQVNNWETPCKRWSDDAKDFVIKNYSSMYAKDISEIIGRSPRAVFDFARRNGLDRVHSNGKI